MRLRSRGKTKTVTGKEVDAVVIRPPAFRKFLLPYLDRVYGVEFAYEQWKKHSRP